MTPGVGPSAAIGASASRRIPLNSRLSSTAVIAAALMPESKIVWNHGGKCS